MAARRGCRNGRLWLAVATSRRFAVVLGGRRALLLLLFRMFLLEKFYDAERTLKTRPFVTTGAARLNLT